MAEEQDQVARDVDVLVRLEREIETAWLPRLKEASAAAARLEAAEYRGLVPRGRPGLLA